MPNSLPPSSSVPVPPSRQPSLVPKESMSNQAIETKSASTHTESQPSSTTQGNNSGYSILEDNQKATRPHLFFKLRQEAQLTSSTSSRPWVSSAQPLIGQPLLMSGQETHYYYATEYQMVFIEKLEGMRKELCRDEMKEVQEYDGRWFICAVCGGILGACIIFRAFIWNPQSAVFVYLLLAAVCILFLGAGVYINWRKSKLFEWPRHAILRRRKELKEVVDTFDNDELTTKNAQHLTNHNLMLIELKDAQSRVNRLKKSLMDQDFFEEDHNLHITMIFIGAVFYLVAITFMVFFLHSSDPPNYCYYPSNYRYASPPPYCRSNPPNY